MVSMEISYFSVKGKRLQHSIYLIIDLGSHQYWSCREGSVHL